VQIPFNLVGKKAIEVMALINAANLKGVYIAGTESSDIVVEVSPSSGTLVPYGSTVEILGEPEQIGPQTPANP
jgi:hypothetical protein